MNAKIDINFQKKMELKNGKEIVLRYLNPGDIDAVLEFVNTIAREDTFVTMCKEFSYDEELDWLVNLVKNNRIGKEICISAFDGDKYLGCSSIMGKESRSEHGGGFGIAIAKEVRGLGLGRILIEEAFRQAKDIMGKTMVDFTCFADNTRAIRLYKDMGCIEFGRLPKSLFYKGEYVDQLFFYKNL